MRHPRRLVVPLAFVAALATSAAAATGTFAHITTHRPHAAPVFHAHPSKATNIPATREQWQQYDTAAYVVSTLNLLTGENARAFSARLRRQYHVLRYDVYADVPVRNLYFVQLRSSNNRVIGVLAYRMGWSKPEALNAFAHRVGARNAPHSVLHFYRSSELQLLGTFDSTLPSYH